MPRVILLFLAFCLPISAQESASANVRVRFAAQRVPRGMGKIVLVAGEELSAPFKLPVNNLSTSQKVAGRLFTVFLEGAKTKLATVALPAQGTDFIVLLVVGDAKSPFKPVVIPGKDDSFRPGDVYMFNASKKSTVLGQVGTTKFVVGPAKGQVVRPAGAKEEGRFFDVLLGVREATGNKVISTSRWPVEERIRSYVFFFDDPKRKSVDFRAIDEFVPVEKKKAG